MIKGHKYSIYVFKKTGAAQLGYREIEFIISVTDQ